MSIIRLHHVQITVGESQEAAARAFYCGVLGLTEIEKPDSLKTRGGFWVKLGDVEVHIGVEEGIERAKSKAHIAYQVDDLAYWQARLRQHGTALGDCVPIAGYARFEFRDPFGNRVEFIMPTSSS